MTAVNDEQNAPAEPAESGSKNGLTALGDFMKRWHLLIALALIIAFEFVCFGPIVNKVGFYLDDWITLNLIQWGPKSFFSAFHQYLLSDPRVIVRPVEAFFYVVEFFVFGLKPIGYHLVNAALEIASAFLLYVALCDLTRKPALSLVAGLILIAYPNHDVTHYWSTCSSENVSLALSMASLALTTKGAIQGKLSYHCWSVVCFLLSIFCYETFLPLVSLNAFFAYIVFLRSDDALKAFKRATLVSLPFALSVIPLLIYSRVIAPMLGPAQVHAVHFDLRNIINVVVEGVRINCPPYSVQYFAEVGARAYEYTSAKTLWTTFGIAAAVLMAAMWGLLRVSDDKNQPTILLPLGLITVVLSYTIFGLNPEYFPTFQTLVNRINEGAAVGIAIATAGFIALILRMLGAKAGSAVQALVIAAVLLPMLALSFIADRGYAQPWILSWYTQKVIQDSLKANAGRFRPGDSIILANCPRYVMWAPLFDGVWDFQPMLQLTLKSRDIKGGVVSERMEIQNNQLKDISRGVVCNTYDFSKLFIIIPPKGEIVPIHSAEEFISTIEQRGFGFGLERAVLSKWRSQLSRSK
ncbi:MAG: hypothetical protein U0103_21635 [Candidatus Obscuribacterales bacterium]